MATSRLTKKLRHARGVAHNTCARMCGKACIKLVPDFNEAIVQAIEVTSGGSELPPTPFGQAPKNECRSTDWTRDALPNEAAPWFKQ